MEQLLAGKVALVTGAAHPQGIGHGIVKALSAAGASVVAMDLASAEGFDSATMVPCDVTDRAQVDAAVATVVGRYDRIDGNSHRIRILTSH